MEERAPGAVTVPDSGSEAPGSDSDPQHSHSYKKSCYLNPQKMETMKHRNWIWDHISEITGIGTSF